MRFRSLVAALILAAGLPFAAACTHITTRVPGTLDMRSDGAGAPAGKGDPKKLPATEVRTGFDGILWGDGVSVTGSTVNVVDRKYHALRLFSIANESATEELNVVLANGGVRKITIGEQLSGWDVLIGLVPNLLHAIPFIGNTVALVIDIVTPPLDVNFSGELMQGYGTPASSSSPAGAP